MCKIPRLQHKVIIFLRFGKVFYCSNVLLSSFEIMGFEILQKFIHLLRSLCHSVLKNVGCVVLITQQLSKFHSQIHQLATYLKVIEFVFLCAFCHISTIQLFAQFSDFRILHKGDKRRSVQCNNPTFYFFLLCSCFRLVYLTLRKAFKLRFICDV